MRCCKGLEARDRIGKMELELMAFRNRQEMDLESFTELKGQVRELDDRTFGRTTIADLDSRVIELESRSSGQSDYLRKVDLANETHEADLMEHHGRLKDLEARAAGHSVPGFDREEAAEEPAPNVLEEANKLTAGDRQDTYGAPGSNAERWAMIASAATGLPLQAADYPVVMIAAKLARVRPGADWHRDTWVDVAGYARVAEMIEDGP